MPWHRNGNWRYWIVDEVSMLDILKIELKPWVEKFERGEWELSEETSPALILSYGDRLDIYIEPREGNIVLYGVNTPMRSDEDEYTAYTKIPMGDPNMLDKLKAAITETARELYLTLSG